MVNTDPHLPSNCFIFALRNQHGRYAWRVQVKRQGKTFSFSQFGGEEPARQMAELFRSELIREPMLITHEIRQRLLASQATHCPGIYRVQSNSVEYWRACTRVYGYTLSKSFRVDRHGDEKARHLALRERKRQLALCNEPYEQAMEKLQRHFSKSNATVREKRIKAAINGTRQVEPSATALPRQSSEDPLFISPEQADLAIIRHFAASAK